MATNQSRYLGRAVAVATLNVAGFWSFGTYNEPREYGAQLQYSFGETK